MKKATSVLLENPEVKKIWAIRIELSGGEWAELRYSMKLIATGEYNRIRAQGTYGGLWIKSIEMGEL
jgi:hypothetical protein